MEQLQAIKIKGMGNQNLNIEYEPHLKTRVKLKLTKSNGEHIKIIVDGSLFSTLVSILQRVLLKWDGLILVTGDVGDGKSTIAQLVCTIWEWFFGRKQNIDCIVFRSENFVEQIEREDNATQCILWDEAIQGGTGRDSITKQGQTLKKAFVTKRYKRHLYLLLVDEIQEYNKKIISRCRAWIHVHTKGLERGYFKIYDDKTQIKRMYRRIKQYNLELEEVIKTEFPSFQGYQADTTGLFFDEKEYQNKKSTETNKEDAVTNTKDNKVIEQRNTLIHELNKLGMKQIEISKLISLNKVSVSSIIKEKSESK